MRQIWNQFLREKVILLAAFVLLIAVILGVAVFAGMLDSAVTAQVAAVTLTPTQHPVGTRILQSCAGKPAADECVVEMMVADWSPSGRFVKLAAVGFITAGEWKLPRQIRVVELLAVPKAEPVSKKLPEMVLSEGGKVRLQ